MAGEPYIGRKYRRIPHHPTLPMPYPGAKVGLACPNCPGNDRSLVYVHGGLDTIKVKCDTIDKHYYRTFKLNQLRHEIAMINAGAIYPIAFDASAHGPPVNIHGECARPTHGPTAAKHRVHGNLGCTSHYCKACCAAFGLPGGCYEHRPKGPNRPQPPAASNTSSTPPVAHLQPPGASNIPAVAPQPPAATSTPTFAPPRPPVTLPLPKRARGIPPPQCSQSVRRVGRILPEESLAVLERARDIHSDATRRASKPSFDEGKVVSLHFVNKDDRNPIISHLFETWPLASLDECPSLARQVKDAAGATWDGNVLVWDEQVRNWREIPMNLPHRYIQSARNLVICIPADRSLLTHQLQEVLEGLGLGKPNIHHGITQASSPSGKETGTALDHSNATNRHGKSSNWFGAKIISLDDYEDGADDLSPQQTTNRPTSPLAIRQHPTTGIAGSSSQPICIDLTSASDDDQPEMNATASSAAPLNQLDPALLTQVDAIKDQVDQKPSQEDLRNWTAPPQIHSDLLQDWPGNTLPVSKLLEWYNSSSAWGTRIPQWFICFGNQYKFHEPTAYRYWKWVSKVDYDRLIKWLEEWPEEGEVNRHNLTVDRARRYFQSEFNAVSSLKNSVAREPSDAIDLDASEHLGWRALPFDEPEDVHADVVFSLVRSHDEEITPPIVLDFKWACKIVHVNVDQTQYNYYWDGRTTHNAVMDSGTFNLPLNAVALDLRHDTLGHHLRFAQMYVHAACLLKKFKKVFEGQVCLTSAQEERLNNLRNVVLCKADGGNPKGHDNSHRCFNLREPIKGRPIYITSDCEFGPAHRAKGFIGNVLACFTHWTYDYHGKKALICGFRGVGEVITDLTIMDAARPWFLNNTFTGGLQSFASNHVCSSITKASPHWYASIISNCEMIEA
ncbi:hypothetical protein DFH28DRAFT_1100595 [Melampsora americana]|nr:hypothetical protein DFH28DRAFT_1100595 [Melampsora americana]